MATPILKLAHDNHRSPTRRINFTRAALDAIKPPATGRLFIYDARQKGLAMCITPTGHKAFYLYRWVGNKPVKMKLSDLADLSIEQARARVLELGPTIAKGQDPAEAKRRQNLEGSTLQAAFDLFIEAPGSRTRRPRSPKTISEYEKQVKTYLAKWKSRQLASITPADVKKLHTKLGKDSGPYLANRVLALLSAIYGYAIRNGYPGANPAVNIERFHEQANMRFLRSDELTRFMEAVDKELNRTAADVIKMLLYTGARRGNVLAMRWTEVDLLEGTWHIPQVKGGDPLDVGLSAQALEILNRRERVSEFVFPSQRKPGQHYENPNLALTRITKAAGLAHVRVHDLRHSLASMLVNNGVSLPLIGRQLGHKTLSTTAKYAHADLSAARQGLNAAMDEAMKEVK